MIEKEVVQLAGRRSRSGSAQVTPAEVAAMITGEPFVDPDEVLSPVIAGFISLISSGVLAEDLELFWPLLTRIAASKEDKSGLEVEVDRAYQIANSALKETAPLALAALGYSQAAAELRDGADLNLRSNAEQVTSLTSRIENVHQLVSSRPAPREGGHDPLSGIIMRTRTVGQAALTLVCGNNTSFLLRRKESSIADSASSRILLHAAELAGASAKNVIAAAAVDSRVARVIVQMQIDLLDRICPEPAPLDKQTLLRVSEQLAEREAESAPARSGPAGLAGNSSAILLKEKLLSRRLQGFPANLKYMP